MQTEAVLELLRDVAATIVRPRFRALAEHEIFEKSPGDLVTVADREAEVAIEAALRAAYPDAVIVGEEAVAARPGLTSGLLDVPHWFTIDPVDGTRNFVRGAPYYGLMVGEVRDGVPVRAWIYQPETRVSVVGERGAGVWANGKPVARLSPSPEPAGWLGRASQPIWRGRSFADLAPLQDTAWSCAVDYPLLVQGLSDFVLYSHSAVWDHVPGMMMLSELGGAGRHLDGEPWRAGVARGAMVVGASPEVVDYTVEAVAAAAAPIVGA